MSVPFSARYQGRCDACGEDIYPGQSIRYERDALDSESGYPVHVDCEEPSPDERPVTICPACHLTMPCDCEDPS
jgi:hypothetical protein